MRVRPAIETRVGHSGADEYRFWGHRVFAELLGKTNTTQMLMCSISGRMFDASELGIVDDIVTAMSSADARLWPFKISRLGATYGSATNGVAAALMASQSAVFGARRFTAIAASLVAWHERAVAGQLEDDVLAREITAGALGFGVLYGTMDPRFDTLMAQAAKRGRGELPLATLAARAARLSRTHGLEPHAFVAVCAIALDLGLTVEQVGLLGMLPLVHVALAHAAESAQQQSPLIQCLSEHDIVYVGRAARLSPRALEHVGSRKEL